MIISFISLSLCLVLFAWWFEIWICPELPGLRVYVEDCQAETIGHGFVRQFDRKPTFPKLFMDIGAPQQNLRVLGVERHSLLHRGGIFRYVAEVSIHFRQ